MSGSFAWARQNPHTSWSEVAGASPGNSPFRPKHEAAAMWKIDLQILLLCFIMPPAGSYAIKYIYVGPMEADFTTVDLCLNLLLTLCGFVPGIVHALHLFARHKGCALAMAVDAAFVWLLLALEALVVWLMCRLRLVDLQQQQQQQQSLGPPQHEG